MTNPRRAAIAVAVLVLGTGVAAAASGQSSPAGSENIKAVLLRPTGWKVDFGHGLADFVYEARGETVVVRIHGLSRTDGKHSLSCESDVTITSDSVIHDGCRDRAITLVFDPEDREFPFKGESQGGIRYRLKPK